MNVGQSLYVASESDGYSNAGQNNVPKDKNVFLLDRYLTRNILRSTSQALTQYY